MSDLEDIRELLVRYCELIDAADFDGVGQLFAEGAIADGEGNEIARGAEAVSSFYRSIVKLHDGSPRTKQLVLNVILEAPTVVRSSYLVLQQIDDAPLQPIITGRYRDTVRRTDDGWAFEERRFFVDLSGDLSHHLG